MKTLSLSEAKMKLSALVDDVRATDQGVMITKNGAPAAVLVSPDEFESWRETIAIRFKESIDAVKSGLEALKEELAGLRSFRIGRFRVVYRLAEDRTIEVVSTGPRRAVYQETFRRLRREND